MGGVDGAEEPSLVHLLRVVTVELDLLGASFARRHQLHPTDLRALIHLLDAARAGHPATPSWLAGQLDLDRSSVTTVVDRLERQGHVHRRRDPADGRRVLLEVDPRAVSLGQAFFGPLIGATVAALEPVGESEQAAARRVLNAVALVIREHRRDHLA